jgi:radical SAM superfamily enzyme YgiQ (UPF0313 family)
MYDDNDAFFKKLVSDHVSGQLKVAPEHISDRVLDSMGKPHIDVYNAFKKKYFDYCREIGKEQYLINPCQVLIHSMPNPCSERIGTLASLLVDNTCRK